MVVRVAAAAAISPHFLSELEDARSHQVAVSFTGWTTLRTSLNQKCITLPHLRGLGYKSESTIRGTYAYAYTQGYTHSRMYPRTETRTQGSLFSHQKGRELALPEPSPTLTPEVVHGLKTASSGWEGVHAHRPVQNHCCVHPPRCCRKGGLLHAGALQGRRSRTDQLAEWGAVGGSVAAGAVGYAADR